MDNIINFNNARRIQNCRNLCYTNSGIHLLYSIVEFRELIYNTAIYNLTNLDALENKYLYYLKYIFLLMNKDLIKTGDLTNKYTVTDQFIQCSRDSNGNYNPFYNEIYKPFLELSIILYKMDTETNEKHLNKLKECKFNENFINRYLSILKNIT